MSPWQKTSCPSRLRGRRGSSKLLQGFKALLPYFREKQVTSLQLCIASSLFLATFVYVWERKKEGGRGERERQRERPYQWLVKKKDTDIKCIVGSSCLERLSYLWGTIIFLYAGPLHMPKNTLFLRSELYLYVEGLWELGSPLQYVALPGWYPQVTTAGWPCQPATRRRLHTPRASLLLKGCSDHVHGILSWIPAAAEWREFLQALV